MDRPNTLKELLLVAHGPLWNGLKYRNTAIRNIEELIETVGDLRLDEISIEVFDKWKSVLEKKVGPSTINRKLTNIHSLLQFAIERKWMKEMPKLPWRPESPGRIRWLTDDEEKQMFELLVAWGEHEVASFVTVLIETGMRRSELLNLRPEDVDGPWARLWETKLKQPRSVPLSARAQQALKSKLPWKLNIVKLRRVWERLRTEMGLAHDKHFVLHALRHTTATRLLKKSNNIVIVQKLLGHRQIKGTLRYAHINDQDLLNAVVTNNVEQSAAAYPSSTIIQIELDAEIEQDEVAALFKAHRSPFAEKPGELIEALKNSTSLVTARVNGRLIGLANAISDGHFFVYYPHALIHPDFQGQGIGKRMMESLRKKYAGFRQQEQIAELD